MKTPKGKTYVISNWNRDYPLTSCIIRVISGVVWGGKCAS